MYFATLCIGILYKLSLLLIYRAETFIGHSILVKFNDFLEYFGFQYGCNMIY